MPILKNDGVRQWGWDDISYMKRKILQAMFQTTNHIWCGFYQQIWKSPEHPNPSIQITKSPNLSTLTDWITAGSSKWPLPGLHDNLLSDPVPIVGLGILSGDAKKKEFKIQEQNTVCLTVWHLRTSTYQRKNWKNMKELPTMTSQSSTHYDIAAMSTTQTPVYSDGKATVMKNWRLGT